MLHRLVTQDDLDAVHAIYMHPAVHPFLGHDPMPREAFVPVLEDLVAGGGFHAVEVAGRIQGFYRITRHAGRARHGAMIGTFAVDPQAHGTGLARAILETVIRRLQAEGVTRVELMLEADNPRALRFYTRLGFVLEGRMHGAYQRADEPQPVDELFMALLLPPPAEGDANSMDTAPAQPAPFRVERIDHLVLRVRSLEASIRFYAQVLGCTVERRRPDLGLVHLRAGASMLDLITVDGPLGQAGGAAPGPQARNLDHLCLRVEPFAEAALVAHLAACGIRPRGPASRNFGAEGEGLSLYFADPDGNTIELKGPATAAG